MHESKKNKNNISSLATSPEGVLQSCNSHASSGEVFECEIWKDVKGYEGLYQVSNLGNIRNIKKGRKQKNRKLIINKFGYISFTLCKNGIKKMRRVNRLVAIAFILNPENKTDVNHIDGNKLNNIVENLEWTTRQENETHAMIHGLKAKGETSGVSKLKEKQVLKIRSLKGILSHRQIAIKFNISKTNAGDIIRRKIWKHI